ncbi:MAG: DNA polymerase III PolC-type [Candidatus Hepatoplasma vulgare]|nr:MAG: DNA polymerase III PolC-type [Candidatus Hepatoplasma sp.]
MSESENTFIKSLNLKQKLKEKINFEKAIFYQDNFKKDLFFSLEDNLSAKELFLFLEAIKNHNEFKNDDIYNIYFNLNKKSDFKNYELYEYLITFLKLISFKINPSNFYFKFEKEELILFISNSVTYEFILENYDNLNKLFFNLKFLNKKFKLIHDGSKFKKNVFIDNDRNKYKELIQKNQFASSANIDKNYKKINFEKESTQRKVYFEGLIFEKESFKRRDNKYNVSFFLKNGDDYIIARKEYKDNLENKLTKNDYVRVYGSWELNKYRNEFNLQIERIEKIQSKQNKKSKTFEKTRTELHIHSKMSVMDGIGDVEDYFKKANEVNIKSLAFVDHNSVQAFPEVFSSSKKYPEIKAIYGVEFDIFDDLNNPIVLNERDADLLKCEYVFFDLETTGISPFVNEIIEFGAVKQINGEIIERKQLFIKPNKSLPKHISELTHITNEHLKNAKPIEEVINEIKEWIGDAILVAHNAKFDYSFLNYVYKKNGLGELKNPVIDTLKISWLVNPNLKNHRLGTVVKNEGQFYDENISHRADYDAMILQKTFENMLYKLFEKDIRNLKDLNKYNSNIFSKIFTNHFTVLAKNQDGIKDLYRLISIAHIDYFNKKKDLPLLPLSILLKERKNLLIGSSCANGKLWEELNNQSNNLEKIFSYYDYIEIFPPSVYQNLINNKFYSLAEIQMILKEIIIKSNEFNKRVVITSDAHYVNKEDHEIRDVYISNKGLGGKLHPLFKRGVKLNSPYQYLRDSNEIYKEFKEFIEDENLLEKIIFKNPNKISSIIEENIIPLKSGLFTPKLKGAEESLIKLVKENLRKTYGDNPHPEIIERFNKELDAIIKNGYAIIYYISSLAVKKSIDDGYLVGSRGSVGSSLIATLAEITEVNPLKPHYLCKKCKYHEFIDNVSSGYDLDNKICPKCGEDMQGEGQLIPFETFLGFEGKKIPDIDLNFSREYQSIAHNFIKSIMGENNVFRAGTISTVAQRTAFGYVKNWEELNNLNLSRAKLTYLSEKVKGTKRTTGQHPGGLIVLPDDKNIYDFTPINFPGNDLNSDWLTTHFDFHSIHDNLLKLDFLGHLDPSSIKMLQELTGIDPLEIPKNDKKVISLFRNTSALKYIENYVKEEEKTLGILGISEFGTKFVRDLVRVVKPTKFSELVKISGLSHGTDVWTGNAKELMENEIARFDEIISVRDDIMTYLISKGINEFISFQIMESVRKGNGLKPEWEDLMKKHKIPSWYLDSANKIKYIFPKAHAAAYVLMAYRIAWYKIYYPLEYYATFFTKRDTTFDIKSLNNGLKGILDFKQYVKKATKEKTSDKEKEISETYSIVLEMYSRGFSISKLSLEKSMGEKWIIDKENKSLIPPFSILEGIGKAVIEKLISSREKGLLKTYESFKIYSGLNKTLLTQFNELGLLKNLKNINIKNNGGQLFLFDN